MYTFKKKLKIFILKQLTNISFLILLTISTLSISGQDVRFSNVIGEQKYEYGIRGNSVIRFDSQGNSIWVKNFTGNIATLTYPNHLVGSAFDGTSLYVLELQGSTFAPLPQLYNGAIIKLDTSGNVQFIIVSTVQPGGGYNLVDIYPSFSKGVWVVDDYSPGHTHLADASYFDSSGTAGPSVNFWYWSYAHFIGMHLLPDSNYIACVNEEVYAGIDMFPALTKFRQNGSVVWRKNYNTTLTNTIEYLNATTTTIDSSGNFYMFCSEYSGSFNGTVGIKVKSNGVTLLSRYWPGLVANDIKSLRYQNGQLIAFMNGSEISFDTLFNISCIPSQNISLIESNDFQYNGREQTYLPGSFIPTDDTSFSYVVQAYPDYCSVLSAENIFEKTSGIELFPNPFKNKITINNINSDHLEIIDFTGRIVYSESVAGESNKMIYPKVPAGIYFLRLQNEGKSKTFKLVCIQ